MPPPRQHRPLSRGTHAKGVSVRAQFEVFDVTVGRAAVLADPARAGAFRKAWRISRDRAVCELRSRTQTPTSRLTSERLSFSVDLTRNGTASPANVDRQDFSLQSATTLPINDAPAFLATMKVLTASNPGAGLWSLPFKDKLRVLRTLDIGAIAVAPGRSNLISNASLLEHCAVPSRTHRCGEAVC